MDRKQYKVYQVPWYLYTIQQYNIWNYGSNIYDLFIVYPSQALVWDRFWFFNTKKSANLRLQELKLPFQYQTNTSSTYRVAWLESLQDCHIRRKLQMFYNDLLKKCPYKKRNNLSLPAMPF